MPTIKCNCFSQTATSNRLRMADVYGRKRVESHRVQFESKESTPAPPKSTKYASTACAAPSGNGNENGEAIATGEGRAHAHAGRTRSTRRSTRITRSTKHEKYEKYEETHRE